MDTRRGFLRRSTAAFAGLTAASWPAARSAAAPPTRPAADRPNVLFIAVDDLRPQLGCYGHEQMISPHIDRLAASGTRFDRAYCQIAVCGASRASLLSGLRPTRDRFLSYKTWKDKDAPHAASLPAHLKANGYETVSLGKVYHHGNDDRDAWGIRRGTPGAFPGYVAGDNAYPPRGTATEAADVDDTAYADGKLREQAVQHLGRLADGDAPFFLAVGFHKPHLAFACPKRYWDLYDRDAIDLADNPFAPKGCPPIALHNWGELRSYGDIPQRGPLADEKARELIHGYYACVSFIDAQIGKLLAELDRLKLADNTVVVLWGDHGWNLGEHGLWCKHANFETSVHVPLVIRAPGMPTGRSTAALSEFVDLYPTLCELAGVPGPDHLQGASAVPLLAGETGAATRRVPSQARRSTGGGTRSSRTATA